METKEIKVTLEKEELSILMFALKHDLDDSIETHYKHLQNSDNEHKREVFFEQNQDKLKLLKDLSGLFSCDVYSDIIYSLDQNIPKGVEK